MSALALVQELLIAAHLLPEPGPERVMETHISWVFLAGARALKVKRPVRFPFLDYSTPERRRAFCYKELELGRLFTPELYLGVRELGEETVLVMRRFPEGARLDEREQRGLLDMDAIDALAAEIAVAHARCPVVPAPRARALLARQRTSFGHDFQELDALAATAGEQTALAHIAAWVNQEHARVQPLALRRADTGRVREAHGDLHLANVVWLDGAPRLFDPIEFNDDFRSVDVAADLAFMVMDLSARDHADLAARLVERYVAVSGDDELPELLPYHVTQRALVRAKVAMIGRRAVAERVIERDGVETALNHYLGLALDEQRRTVAQHLERMPGPDRSLVSDVGG